MTYVAKYLRFNVVGKILESSDARAKCITTYYELVRIAPGHSEKTV